MATKTKEANKAFPLTNPAIRQKVDEIGVLVDTTKRAKAAEEKEKGELKSWLKPIFFDANLRKHDVTFIYDLAGRKKIAQVDFINKYRVDQERYEALQESLSNINLEKFFIKTYDIKINPNTLTGVDKVEFLTKLKTLCDNYAVEVSIDDKYMATPTFHKDRHQINIQTNEQIDSIVPMEIQITY